jgi:membrane-associated phospholipid phosphatase
VEVDPRMPNAEICDKWPTRWLSAAGILSLLVALVVTALVVAENSTLLAVDEWVNSTVNDWARGAGWPVEIASWIGIATGPVFSVIYSAVAVVVLVLAGRRRWAILVAAAGIAGVTIAESLKVVIARPRPPGAELYAHDLDKSFPSGHATAGIYLYVCLAIILILLAKSQDRSLLRGVGIALFVFGILIGVSRIALGVHWLSDVVAGWLFGTATLLIALALIHPECDVPDRSTIDHTKSEANE